MLLVMCFGYVLLMSACFTVEIVARYGPKGEAKRQVKVVFGQLQAAENSKEALTVAFVRNSYLQNFAPWSAEVWPEYGESLTRSSYYRWARTSLAPGQPIPSGVEYTGVSFGVPVKILSTVDPIRVTETATGFWYKYSETICSEGFLQACARMEASFRLHALGMLTPENVSKAADLILAAPTKQPKWDLLIGSIGPHTEQTTMARERLCNIAVLRAVGWDDSRLPELLEKMENAAERLPGLGEEPSILDALRHPDIGPFYAVFSQLSADVTLPGRVVQTSGAASRQANGRIVFATNIADSGGLPVTWWATSFVPKPLQPPVDVGAKVGRGN